jgi:hypothetical protein
MPEQRADALSGLSVDLQVMRAGNRVVVIRRNAFKTVFGIERADRLHVVQRVEQHAVVARHARSIQRRFRQVLSQAKPAIDMAHK